MTKSTPDISPILKSFGGVTALAKALGRAPTTVQYWKDTGCIPQGNWKAVISAGKKNGLVITVENLFAGTAPVIGKAAGDFPQVSAEAAQ